MRFFYYLTLDITPYHYLISIIILQYYAFFISPIYYYTACKNVRPPYNKL